MPHGIVVFTVICPRRYVNRRRTDVPTNHLPHTKTCNYSNKIAAAPRTRVCTRVHAAAMEGERAGNTADALAGIFCSFLKAFKKLLRRGAEALSYFVAFHGLKSALSPPTETAESMATCSLSLSLSLSLSPSLSLSLSLSLAHWRSACFGLCCFPAVFLICLYAALLLLF